MINYQNKAKAIIEESIKSAVFIDEKALEPYTEKSPSEITEEKLSNELFINFRQKKISLAIHKFKITDTADITIKDYLFENRDLILLDWKLAGNSGEEHSLKLLTDIVERPHIHFCCIYTSEDDIDSVFHNVLSYFSNETKEGYDNIKLNLADVETDILSVLTEIKKISALRDDRSCGRLIGEFRKKHTQLVTRIQTEVDADIKCALIKISIAFDNIFKSDASQPCPEIISYTEKVVVIKNTIILILNKKDITVDALLDKISTQISDSKNSFTQLLGVEMQNVFSKKASFVDPSLFSIPKEALLYHRKQLLADDGNDLPFKELIKEVLLEHAKLNVRTSDLTLLDDVFLDSLSVDLAEPHIDDIVQINVFYNSSIKNDETLTFGDVFKDLQNNYYICITSLCDCLKPSKMKNSFYFAKGEKINDKLQALKLGDSAFISYLSKNQIVRWSAVESGLEAELHKYKPIYIKPESYTIPVNNIDANKKIMINQLNDIGVNIPLEVEYVTTIKSNYSQRIANHAFSYPVRVGVDFVKKK